MDVSTDCDESEIVEDSDKDSTSASPYPLLGLSMLWKSKGSQQNLVNKFNFSDDMSPVIPTLSRQKWMQTEKGDRQTNDSKRCPSPTISESERSEVLIPLRSSDKAFSDTAPKVINTEISCEETVDITMMNTERNHDDNDDAVTVDSHTTMGSNKVNYNSPQSVALVSSETEDEASDGEKMKRKGEDKTLDTIGKKKLKQSSKEEDNKEEPLTQDVGYTQEELIDASQSQSLIDPHNSVPNKVARRVNKELERLDRSPRMIISNSQSTKSSKSSENDLKGNEESLRHHHTLEIDLMEKLEKHHTSADKILKRGSSTCAGQVHNLLFSLTPLMHQLRTAHGHERRHVQSQRGKKLNKLQVAHLKLQLGLLIEREKRLSKLDAEHTKLTQMVKDIKSASKKGKGISDKATIETTKTQKQLSGTDVKEATGDAKQLRSRKIVSDRNKDRWNSAVRSKINQKSQESIASGDSNKNDLKFQDDRSSETQKRMNINVIKTSDPKRPKMDITGSQPRKSMNKFIIPQKKKTDKRDSLGEEQVRGRTKPDHKPQEITTEDNDSEVSSDVQVLDNDCTDVDEIKNTSISSSGTSQKSETLQAEKNESRAMSKDEAAAVGSKQNVIYIVTQPVKPIQTQSVSTNQNVNLTKAVRQVLPSMDVAKFAGNKAIQGTGNRHFFLQSPPGRNISVLNQQSVLPPQNVIHKNINIPQKDGRSILGSPDSSVYGSTIFPLNTSPMRASGMASSTDRVTPTPISNIGQSKQGEPSRIVTSNHSFNGRTVTVNKSMPPNRQLPQSQLAKALSTQAFPAEQSKPRLLFKGPSSANTPDVRREIHPPSVQNRQRTSVQVTRKSGSESTVFPDLPDLLRAKVLEPGEKLLSMEVQGQTFRASLTAGGWIRGGGGEVFRTPMTWYKALNPEAHKMVITKKIAYPKILYKGTPLSKYELPTTPTALQQTAPLVLPVNQNYIRVDISSDRTSTRAQPPLTSNPNKRESFLTELLKDCKVAIHSDNELFPNNTTLPPGFWDISSWKNIEIPRDLMDQIDVW